MWGSFAHADTTQQAIRIFNNLNGVPATEQEIESIKSLLDQGKLTDAALMAIDTRHGSFYRTTLRGLTNIWVNESRSGRFPLTDLQATVIGMTRDNKPFDGALYEDLVYIADPASAPEGMTIPEYSLSNNDHYEFIEKEVQDFHTKLIPKKQSELTSLPTQVTSGLLTSRGFGAAYYIAGTNRAAVRFAMMNFMCRDMEQLSDTSRPDLRVRQDVSRNPGGDAETYKSKCVGCHAGMDALGGAFAYLDFDENTLIYNPLKPRDKYFANSDSFPGGYLSVDDSWINLWVSGPNEILGWRGAAQGKGVKSLGKMISSTAQFSQCMAQHAVQAICRVPGDHSEFRSVVNALANRFELDRYNLKHLFANAALSCRGE